MGDSTAVALGERRLYYSECWVHVYHYICQRLKLERETENMGVCTKERKGDTAEVLMEC